MPKYPIQLTHRIISIIGLGNPEPKYQNTRHNVAALVIRKMWSQLASLKTTKAFKAHTLIARTRAEPGSKQFTRHLTKFFDEKVIAHTKADYKPKYVLELNIKETYFEGIKMMLFTPTLLRNMDYDGPPFSVYDYDFPRRFDLYRHTYCLGYVDNTFMNQNGKVVANFFEKQQKFFEEQVKDVIYYLDGEPTDDFTFSNYIMADDVETPIGKVKIRDKYSSDRGHNGLRDCKRYLGIYEDIPYVKISVGISLKNWENDIFSELLLRDFVLGEFTPKELDYLNNESIPMLWDELHKLEMIVAAK